MQTNSQIAKSSRYNNQCNKAERQSPKGILKNGGIWYVF